MRSQVISLVFIAAAVSTVSGFADADAKPRRVVVLEFDGPRRLADSGRSAVMGVLGDQYNIVATKSWDTARARAAGRGPQQWRQASKQAGVDAVIEGWVQTEGRHHVLTVAVREAATGRELDTLSIRIKDDGVTPDASQKLAVQLDDLLSWIDGDINAEPTPTLPDVRGPMLGSHVADRDRSRRDDDEESIDRDRDEPDDDDRDNRRDDDSRKSKASDKRAEPKKQVASAREPDQDTNDLVTLFGPESKEAEIVSEGKTTHTPKPTPRFIIGAGPYVSARGMTFDYDPQAKGNPPEYPGQTLKGFAAGAAVYPMPRDKQDGQISGVGFSLHISHSVLSKFSGMDDSGYGDYTLNHVAWNTGIHYRWPIDFVSIDVDADFGNFSHRIVDLPASIQIPDTSYSYLGAGGHLDLQVTDGTTVGFGAHYMYLLSAGDISDQDWYGAGTAWGATLDADFVIPISGALFIKGAVEYQRVKVDFEGSGMLAETWGVWDVVDSSISGSASLGVKF
ncbi:MAG TPA: hypothetical protein VIV40_40620 [Kofleriaceae bacterium]